MKKQRKNNPIVIGLTGSFGSGKSTIAKMFKTKGARVIDADKISCEVIRPQTKAYQEVVEVFGRRILDNDGRINRPNLARLVFSNKKLLEKLNRITHPKIIALIKEKIRNSGSKVLVIDAPLLIEAGLRNMVDKLVVVDITRTKQLERLLKKKTLRKADILRRLNSQLPLAKKVALADFVIDNSGLIKETRRQVIKIIKRLIPRNLKE